MAIQLINEAVRQGARAKPACETVGISCRTLQNWQRAGLQDQRQQIKKIPSNKLSEQERAAILEVCNSEEFKSQAPKQIVPTLADRGLYMASESSFYRILRDADQLHHRGHTAPANKIKPEPYTADGPNQVWSWDITYLASTLKGVFFYLYLFMDIYSRKIVGWEVHENESSEQAAEILRKTRLAEAIGSQQELVLHSDNGSPMKGATMLATLQKLGVVPSFSRPSVSNDNPYSESLFRTLKYTPCYPSKPFESVEQARKWVATFVQWYVPPVQRHQGKDRVILAQRKQVYEEAKKQHPERWSGDTRNWEHEPIVQLNPANKQQKKTEARKAA